jgi:hypothetical protein
MLRWQSLDILSALIPCALDLLCITKVVDAAILVIIEGAEQSANLVS